MTTQTTLVWVHRLSRRPTDPHHTHPRDARACEGHLAVGGKRFGQRSPECGEVLPHSPHITAFHGSRGPGHAPPQRVVQGCPQPVVASFPLTPGALVGSHEVAGPVPVHADGTAATTRRHGGDGPALGVFFLVTVVLAGC
ncbi:hypothetical protein GCM10009574_088510 [Streptomyces asiaticus]|uniref:Uncharacterized protein n=2 Tax=Streptomyces rhizosphaericus TaxID=114699 RepID=A0ABN1SQ80_9ACTN